MTTPPEIAPTLAKHLAAARLHTPFGVLLPHDLHGIYRSVARKCGVPVEAVQAAAEATKAKRDA